MILFNQFNQMLMHFLVSLLKHQPRKNLSLSRPLVFSKRAKNKTCNKLKLFNKLKYSSTLRFKLIMPSLITWKTKNQIKRMLSGASSRILSTLISSLLAQSKVFCKLMRIIWDTPIKNFSINITTEQDPWFKLENLVQSQKCLMPKLKDTEKQIVFQQEDSQMRKYSHSHQSTQESTRCNQFKPYIKIKMRELKTLSDININNNNLWLKDTILHKKIWWLNIKLWAEWRPKLNYWQFRELICWSKVLIIK